MRNAARLSLLLIAAAALVACGKAAPEENSIATSTEIGNGPVDIDTLPPDESVGTSSEELANGVDDANDGEPENGF